MSDDFSDAVKKTLAGRVGHLCSNPQCRALTSGPQEDPTKTVNVGVAAHITAASPGGPRYDSKLSAEERSGHENGIWLCQNCAKLIDNDPARFTVDLLRKWKSEGEAEAKGRLGKTATAVSPKEVPSFVFVFGAPLGDNDSASWVMMLRHYGPKPAHSCNIEFYDSDRKNIEHQWLVAHPNSPFPPPGLAAGESQKRVYVAETGPEGSPGSFSWNPLDPDRQHYTASISCRDGVFVERWEVTRVNGVLRSTITIEHGPQWVEKNPNLDPVVFKCSDPEFISTPLATEVPKLAKKAVHPGWKPNHRFEVPAAIIDPNSNVQVVSGIKLPDGSTLTDFGCWNILTKHFGDETP
jgi:hypothetical protein